MKSIMLYLVLVGIPFLGLLGILRIGETLAVPMSIGGAWVVEPATAQALGRSCGPVSLPGVDPMMVVSQSGRYVQVRFNDAAQTVMVGRLYADTLTVRHVLPSAEHGCGKTTMVVLQLQRSSGEADRLSGWWKTPKCAVCAADAFRAVRSAPH